jgi:hypothetical protein
MVPRYETYISPWHKGVLIPFWVLQLLAILNVIGTSEAGIATSRAHSYYDDDGCLEDEGDGDQFAVVYAILLYSLRLRPQRLR